MEEVDAVLFVAAAVGEAIAAAATAAAAAAAAADAVLGRAVVAAGSAAAGGAGVGLMYSCLASIFATNKFEEAFSIDKYFPLVVCKQQRYT